MLDLKVCFPISRNCSSIENSKWHFCVNLIKQSLIKQSLVKECGFLKKLQLHENRRRKGKKSCGAFLTSRSLHNFVCYCEMHRRRLYSWFGPSWRVCDFPFSSSFPSQKHFEKSWTYCQLKFGRVCAQTRFYSAYNIDRTFSPQQSESFDQYC